MLQYIQLGVTGFTGQKMKVESIMGADQFFAIPQKTDLGIKPVGTIELD